VGWRRRFARAVNPTHPMNTLTPHQLEVIWGGGPGEPGDPNMPVSTVPIEPEPPPEHVVIDVQKTTGQVMRENGFAE